MNLRQTALAGVFMLMASSAMAACAFQNEVPVRMLAGSFEAWKSMTGAMAECGNFTAELDAEFKDKQPAAFAANPSLYHIGGVSNGTFTPLINAGSIRPLDALVAKHGAHLAPNQLIKVDGKIMAVAMMVNAQHLMLRKDIFDELGLAVPGTYDEVLAAAAAIKASGKVAYPLGATMKVGWDLGQDFNNIFLGYGGSFVNADNSPAVNSDAGRRTLEMMAKLSAFMDPEFLSSNSTYVQQQMQQGKIAMANLWASRMAAMDNPAESQVVGKVEGFAAPATVAGGPPATTLWWDGIVIAKNISDAEAEAAFRLAMEGMDTEMVTAHNDDAIWLIKGYVPGKAAAGALATAQASPPAAPYPSTAAMGVMHGAIDANLADFLTGKRSAEETLKAIEAAYLTAAKEAGLL